MTLRLSAFLVLSFAALGPANLAAGQAIGFDDDETFSDACQAAAQSLAQENPEIIELQNSLEESLNFSLPLDEDSNAMPDPDAVCQANEELFALQCTLDFTENQDALALRDACTGLGEETSLALFSYGYDCDIIFFRIIVDISDYPICVPADCTQDILNLDFNPTEDLLEGGDMMDGMMMGNQSDIFGNETFQPNCTFSFSLKNVNGEVVKDENGAGPGTLVSGSGSSTDPPVDAPVDAPASAPVGAPASAPASPPVSPPTNGGSGSSTFATGLWLAAVVSAVSMMILG